MDNYGRHSKEKSDKPKRYRCGNSYDDIGLRIFCTQRCLDVACDKRILPPKLGCGKVAATRYPDGSLSVHFRAPIIGGHPAITAALLNGKIKRS